VFLVPAATAVVGPVRTSVGAAWVQVVVGETLSVALDEAPHLVEDAVELGLVVRVRRGLRLVVELVELRQQVVGDLELPLAHQPDDHCSSSFFAPPAASSPLSFASSSSTWL